MEWKRISVNETYLLCVIDTTYALGETDQFDRVIRYTRANAFFEIVVRNLNKNLMTIKNSFSVFLNTKALSWHESTSLFQYSVLINLALLSVGASKSFCFEFGCDLN